MTKPTENAEYMFNLAKTMLAHVALQAKPDTDLFVLASGLAKLAAGLESMAIGLRATFNEIHDMNVAQKGANMLSQLKKSL